MKKVKLPLFLLLIFTFTLVLALCSVGVFAEDPEPSSADENLAYIPGDVNGDMEIDSKDVTLIRRYIAGYNVSINESAADVTADAEIDSEDVTLIRRYIAGYDVTLLPAPVKHIFTEVEAKDATCTEDGNIAFWLCENCGKKFDGDNNEANEISDDQITIPSTAHSDENSDLICDVCEQEIYSKGLQFTLNEDKASYSVTGIGTCTDTDIIIPATYNGHPVTKIGESAFYKSNITSAKLPKSITAIGASAFFASHITNITIPDGVISIGADAFCQSHLVSIDIPDSVESIGGMAFYDCPNLIDVKIGSGVTSIGNAAFADSIGVIQTEGGVSYVDKWAVDCDTEITNVVLREDTVGIADNAFFDCGKLVSVDIPQSVASIGNFAFSGCFLLSDITLPDSITVISDYSFGNCTSLTGINIPSGVTTIGVDAFANCHLLTGITLPGGLKSIGYNAFSGCESLTEIAIPNGVTKLEHNTFRNCTSLTSIVLGSGITTIEWYAFAYSSVSTVYFAGTRAQWEAIPNNPLDDTSVNVYFYSGSKPVYDGTDYWYYDNGAPKRWIYN